VRLHVEMTPFLMSQVIELTLSLLRLRSHYPKSEKESDGFKGNRFWNERGRPNPKKKLP